MPTVADQIAELEGRGVVFERCTRAGAEHALRHEVGYHHVIPILGVLGRAGVRGDGGADVAGIEFADVLALLRLDDELRTVFGTMALDVERFAKVGLLRRVAEDPAEDGLAIVEDYRRTLTSWSERRLRREMETRCTRRDDYIDVTGIDFAPPLSVWAFLEVATFGQLVDFCRFCSWRWEDPRLRTEHQMLKRAAALRNATAHGHGIVAGLTPANPSRFGLSNAIRAFLGQTRLRPVWRELVRNAPTLDLVTTIWLYGRHAPFGFQRARMRECLARLRDHALPPSLPLGAESYPARCLGFVFDVAEVLDLA